MKFQFSKSKEIFIELHKYWYGAITVKQVCQMLNFKTDILGLKSMNFFKKRMH